MYRRVSKNNTKCNVTKYPFVDRVNFKKNEKTYDAEKSAVFKVLQEEQNDPEPGITDDRNCLGWIFIIDIS